PCCAHTARATCTRRNQTPAHAGDSLVRAMHHRDAHLRDVTSRNDGSLKVLTRRVRGFLVLKGHIIQKVLVVEHAFLRGPLFERNASAAGALRHALRSPFVCPVLFFPETVSRIRNLLLLLTDAAHRDRM